MIQFLINRLRQNLPILIIFLLAIVGAYIVFYATQWGPWAGSDSVEYVEAARNLVKGNGLVLVRATGDIVPMYLRPPFYSIVLAGFLAAGLDVIAAGRIIAVALFFSILLIPALLTKVVKDRYALPIAITGYLLVSPTLVANSTGLMSETLFLLLVFLVVSLAAGALHNENRVLLPMAALLAGLTWITRFAGIASVMIVAIVPFLEGRFRLVPATLRSIRLALLGAVPFVLWTLYVRVGGYQPGIYSFPEGNLWDALKPVRGAFTNLLWEWLPFQFILPIDTYRPKAIIVMLFCTILAVAAGWLAFQIKRILIISKSQAAIYLVGILLVLFSAAHAFMVSISFLLVTTPKPALDQRVLLPSQITFVVGIVLVIYSLMMQYRNPMARLVLPLAFIVPFIASGWTPTWQNIHLLNKEGWGYTSRLWHQAPITSALRRLPPSMNIVSNDIDAVTFYAERPAYFIPELDKPKPISDWVPFGENPQTIPERLFAEGDAALVLFTQGRYHYYLVYGNEAKSRIDRLLDGLYIFYEGHDGGIYLARSP